MATKAGFHADFPFIAGQDLSAYQGKAVLIGAADNVVIPASQNTVQRAFGILMNDPTSGHGAAVTVFGGARVVLGGTVTRGTQLSHDSSAFIIAATSGLCVLGMAVESGVAGDIVNAIINGAATSGLGSV